MFKPDIDDVAVTDDVLSDPPPRVWARLIEIERSVVEKTRSLLPQRAISQVTGAAAREGINTAFNSYAHAARMYFYFNASLGGKATRPAAWIVRATPLILFAMIFLEAVLLYPALHLLVGSGGEAPNMWDDPVAAAAAISWSGFLAILVSLAGEWLVRSNRQQLSDPTKSKATLADITCQSPKTWSSHRRTYIPEQHQAGELTRETAVAGYEATIADVPWSVQAPDLTNSAAEHADSSINDTHEAYWRESQTDTYTKKTRIAVAVAAIVVALIWWGAAGVMRATAIHSAQVTVQSNTAGKVSGIGASTTSNKSTDNPMRDLETPIIIVIGLAMSLGFTLIKLMTTCPVALRSRDYEYELNDKARELQNTIDNHRQTIGEAAALAYESTAIQAIADGQALAAHHTSNLIT